MVAWEMVVGPLTRLSMWVKEIAQMSGGSCRWKMVPGTWAADLGRIYMLSVDEVKRPGKQSKCLE